jgi:AcrR family transcriptional regulator
MPTLKTKKQPAQQRATETYELILDVTAQMLAEVGFERISTNLVCERAGLTPPALYRYFPNKYVLLSELGKRLMQLQNELIPHWITPQVFAGSLTDLEKALQGLILETCNVTEKMKGGVWILRSLRAVPALQLVLQESNEQVTEVETQLLAEIFPNAEIESLRLVCRITVEMISSTIELLFNEPLNRPAVAQIVSSMIASYLVHLKPTIDINNNGETGTAD